MSNESVDIGIDLGTTFSVVAVAGNVTLSPDYQAGEWIEKCGVTIIPSPEGNPTFPSIYWEPPGQPENALIGYDAKAKAAEGEAPIMFSKRSIGTTEPLTIHGTPYTARDIAAKFLRHFKECAEKALGRPVHRAVITHPAYFKPNQIQETREAAVQAGFDMSCDEQLMMEPCAAALAFTRNETKDPLRIMTYDLGGGTFDVTILERKDGVITMKSFDGDHLLGGYDFDRDLAQWIRNQIKSKGRSLPAPDSSAEEAGRYARLLQLAENVKIQLTEQTSAKTSVQITGNFLVDTAGKPISISERITREKYAALIKERIDKTISHCHRALEKASLKPEQLDRLILVGGSTYGQWIVEAVNEAFKIPVEQYEPDLCVAAGAALRAVDLPVISRSGGMELAVNVPKTSTLPVININGILKTGSTDKRASSYRVTVLKKGRPLAENVAVGEEGQFLIKQAPLEPNGPTVFEVQVKEGDSLRLTRQCETTYSTEAVISDIETPLPRPIYLETKNGMTPIAKEGAILPVDCTVECKLLHEGETSVEVDVYQESDWVSRLQVNDIPVDIPAGANSSRKVKITVTVTKDNKMVGKMQVVSSSGTALAEGSIDITFPPIKIPDLAKLRSDFDELEAQRQQLKEISNDQAHRTMLAGKGRKMATGIEKAFQQEPVDRQWIHEQLKEFKALVTPPTDEMKPPRSHFAALLDRCRKIIADHPSDSQIQSFSDPIAKFEKDGHKACTDKNPTLWTGVIDGLEQIASKLKKLAGEDGGSKGGEKELPPTPILKDHFRLEAESLRSELQTREQELSGHVREAKIKVRAEGIHRRIDQIIADIDRVDDNLDPKSALPKLQLAFRDHLKVKDGIENLHIDI